MNEWILVLVELKCWNWITKESELEREVVRMTLNVEIYTGV